MSQVWPKAGIEMNEVWGSMYVPNSTVCLCDCGNFLWSVYAVENTSFKYKLSHFKRSSTSGCSHVNGRGLRCREPAVSG